MPGPWICQGAHRRYRINGKGRGAEVNQQRLVELGAEEFLKPKSVNRLMYLSVKVLILYDRDEGEMSQIGSPMVTLPSSRVGDSRLPLRKAVQPQGQYHSAM